MLMSPFAQGLIGCDGYCKRAFANNSIHGGMISPVAGHLERSCSMKERTISTSAI